MLTNILKISLKVLLRRRFFTFVSLFGTGFTLLVLILAAALADHLLAPSEIEPFRARSLYLDYMLMEGNGSAWNGTPGYGFLDRYCRDLDGAERVTFVTESDHRTAYANGERVDLTLRHTDGAFWDVYDFRFVEGLPYTAEEDASGLPVAVIGESARNRLLGEGPAVGRSVEVGGRTYRVSGVVEDIPRLYRFAAADVYAPIGSMPDPSYRTELMGSFMAVIVAESTNALARVRDDFASRLPLVEFSNDWAEEMIGRPRTALEGMALTFLDADRERVVGRFLAIAAGIVLAFMALPAINLVNVNLSRIYERTSEIGARRAFGASTRDLIFQFVLENIVLCAIGGLIGFAGAAVLIGAVNGSGLLPHSDLALNVRVFAAGMAFAVVFGVLSGVYPAWRMSRMHPVVALRGGA